MSEQLRPVVTAKVARYCGDRDLAEESTQEALARAVAHWGGRQRPDRLEGWLVRVATNVVHDHHRRRANGRRYAPLIATPAHTDEVGIDDHLLVRDLLPVLSDRERAAILLRFFSGCTVAETATAMRCPDGTVKSLTHRGLARLRAALEAAR